MPAPSMIYSRWYNQFSDLIRRVCLVHLTIRSACFAACICSVNCFRVSSAWLTCATTLSVRTFAFANRQVAACGRVAEDVNERSSLKRYKYPISKSWENWNCHDLAWVRENRRNNNKISQQNKERGFEQQRFTRTSHNALCMELKC